MAQLDKLLQQIVTKGGRSLRIEPNQPPFVELSGGGSVPLLPQALPPTMLDHITQEVIPPQYTDAWSQKGQIVFEYMLGGVKYRIAMERSAIGNRLKAEPKDGISTNGSGVQDIKFVDEETGRASPPSSPAIAVLPFTPAIALDSSPAIGLVPAPKQVTTSAPTPPQTPSSNSTPPVNSIFAGPAAQRELHPLALVLFTALLERKGSDIHCTCDEIPVFRINGEMQDFRECGPLGEDQLLGLMHSLATPDAWAKFQSHSDADFAFGFDLGGCRLRVNFFQDRVGPGFVARVIPNEIPDPDRLGLAEPVRQLALLAKGLVLVTGPTGSGKSTTLAAIIDLANQQRMDHIVTIEDPIEFVHPRKKCLINQREVHTHTESFKSGLRAALREDPDIVLVGEMRDLETIAIALETAVTGHLVFGTLHTSSAVGTIDRIVDQFPADRQQQIRVMMADALKAVISQILLKKIGGGRVAAMESLFITPAISNLMREGKIFQIPSAMQVGRAYGQRLMNDVLMDMIQDKKVTAMDAYLKCPDKESFIQTIKRVGINFDPRAGQTGEM
jgi:twitching motility protein PilT